MSKKLLVYSAFTGRKIKVDLSDEENTEANFWSTINTKCSKFDCPIIDRAFDAQGRKLDLKALISLDNDERIWVGSTKDYRHKEMSNRESKNVKTLVKCVIIGPPKVGKSASTFQFVNEQFIADYDPTLEDTYDRKKIIDGHEININITDTAGSEQFTQDVQTWIEESDILFLQFDVNQLTTWDICRSMYERNIKQQLMENDEEQIVCVLGNKCDLEHMVYEEEVRGSIANWDSELFYMSAKDNINVQEAFVHAIRQKMYNLYKEFPKPSASKCCTIL